MDILSTGSGCQYLVVFYVFPDRFKLGLNCPAPVPPPGCRCSRGTASWNMDARYSGFRLPSSPPTSLARPQATFTANMELMCDNVWPLAACVCGCGKIMNMPKCCCLVCCGCGLLLILVIICALGWKLKFALHKLFLAILGSHHSLTMGLPAFYFFRRIASDCQRPIIDGKMVHHLLRNMNSRWSLLWYTIRLCWCVGVFGWSAVRSRDLTLSWGNQCQSQQGNQL